MIAKVLHDCSQRIENFLVKVQRFQPSIQPGGSSRKVKDALRKVQCGLFKVEDVESLRTELQPYTDALQLLVVALQLQVQCRCLQYFC